MTEKAEKKHRTKEAKQVVSDMEFRMLTFANKYNLLADIRGNVSVAVLKSCINEVNTRMGKKILNKTGNKLLLIERLLTFFMDYGDEFEVILQVKV